MWPSSQEVTGRCRRHSRNNSVVTEQTEFRRFGSDRQVCVEIDAGLWYLAAKVCQDSMLCHDIDPSRRADLLPAVEDEYRNDILQDGPDPTRMIATTITLRNECGRNGMTASASGLTVLSRILFGKYLQGLVGRSSLSFPSHFSSKPNSASLIPKSTRC